MLLAVSTDRKTSSNRRGLGNLVGSSSRKLFSVHWSVLFFFFVCFSSPFGQCFILVPSRNNFQCPSCFPLISNTYSHSHNTTDPRGCILSPSPSVHFLSAGQHCLLQEREHKEDPRPLPPFALGEVIRNHIISLLYGGWKNILSC